MDCQREGGKEAGAGDKSMKKYQSMDCQHWIPFALMLLFTIVFWVADSQAWVVFVAAAGVMLLIELIIGVFPEHEPDKEKEKIE